MAPHAAKLIALLARFVLVYGLLMTPWPGWEDAYARIYASAAALIFDSFDPHRSVRIEHLDVPIQHQNSWGQDTAVRLRISGPAVLMRNAPSDTTHRSSRYTGYAPAALAVALAMATPISWRRRALAVPLAVLLASGFSALMLATWIHGWFYLQECIAVAPFSAECVQRAKLVASGMRLSGDMGPYFIAPVFVWVAVTLRRRDLDSFLGRLQLPRSHPVSGTRRSPAQSG